MKHIILATLFLVAAAICRADSWAPPTARVFASANGKFLLHIAPTARRSSPELPEVREENEKQRKALGLNQVCHATLFRREEREWNGISAGFRPVWQQKLVNEVAPMDARISDDGQFVVTTNDYGSLSYGENVVVIYDREGKLIRRFKLTEFIPQSKIDDLSVPQSVSSIEWAGRHSLDTKNGLLLLQVWQSGNPASTDDKTPVQYRTVPIRLSTGEILKAPASK